MATSRLKIHRVLLTALLALGFAGLSHAAPLFSTLGQPDNAAAGLDDTNVRLASDFRTDGTPRTITGLTARMGNTALITHTVTFSIFTDNGLGKPGTLVGAFDTASIPVGFDQLVTATDAGIDLLANTPYWLVGQVDITPVLGTVSWFFNLGEGTDAGSSFSTVGGTQILRSPNAGGAYGNLDTGNLLFSLDGVTAVPEPTSSQTIVVVALLLVAGCTLYRRRIGLVR